MGAIVSIMHNCNWDWFFFSPTYWGLPSKDTRNEGNLLSISSTFFEHIFCMTVFSLLRVWLWMNFRMKNAHIKCWWNWHLYKSLEKLFQSRTLFWSPSVQLEISSFLQCHASNDEGGGILRRGAVGHIPLPEKLLNISTYICRYSDATLSVFKALIE